MLVFISFFKYGSENFDDRAAVAELADAPASGAGGSNLVRVQVSPAAHGILQNF